MTDRDYFSDMSQLHAAVNELGPVVACGFVRPEASTLLRVTYSRRHTAGCWLIDAATVPPAFIPRGDGVVHTPLAALQIGSAEALRGALLMAGGVHVVTVPVPGSVPTLLYAAFSVTIPDNASTTLALAKTAAASQRLLDPDTPEHDPVDRLQRLERVAELAPALFNVRDIRDVVARVSTIMRDVLAHDTLILTTFSDDLSQITTYPATEADASRTLPSPNRQPIALTRALEYHVDRDLRTQATELHTEDAHARGGSSLRLGIRHGETVIGALSFTSRQVDAYRDADVAVGRRIARFVALAISQLTFAEEHRRTDALRARAAALETLDELLNTLAGVLDIRDVFGRVSQIAHQVLPHDALVVREFITDDLTRARNYALTGFDHVEVPAESPVTEPALLATPWDHFIVPDLSERAATQAQLLAAGMRSLLSLPVRLDGRLVASVTFLSHSVGRFGKDDVVIGRRIADHIALAMSHQRLAAEHVKAEELRSRATELELLDDVVTTVLGGGPLKDTWQRLSAVANRVLPHDALVLTVLLPEGDRARVYANHSPEAAALPEFVEVPPNILANKNWDHDIVGDLQADPRERVNAAARSGYRSALRVPIRIDGEYAAGVSFLAFEPHRYTTRELAIAKRIADRIAINVIKERVAAQSKRADEATERARHLEARVRALSDELDARTGYRRVVGQSIAWRDVLKQATQVAATNTTVLLLGDSGTGKEVAARFIHRASSRNHGPFVALNCAALPEQLLEAELFGYERGAFTGALNSKPGQLEQAAGGTLFLDEVGEMSLQAQAKFLRVLQEREFQRLGGTRVLRTDARIVAATNRDLHRAMERNQFREDLYYRLNVFTIHLPPLKDRREDILLLSEAFVAEFGKTLGRPPAGLSRDARSALLDYHWPGNVRELRNVLERAAILADGGLITTEHLALRPPPSSIRTPESMPVATIPATPAEAVSPPSDLMSAERAVIENALREARYNKSQTAKILGLSRAQLYVRLRRHGLE
jgi:two-component system response regulator AtoC